MQKDRDRKQEKNDKIFKDKVQETQYPNKKNSEMREKRKLRGTKMYSLKNFSQK